MNRENIGKILKKLAAEDVPADVQSLAEETSENFSKTLTPSRQHILWSDFLKGRIIKIAAAAVIILAIALLFIELGPGEQIKTHKVAQVTESPAKMLTAMSLNIAYGHGGIEALEKQHKKAYEMLGSRKASVSIQELLAELDDEESERTKL